MIGLIVTGHGSFATGITSGLELLAGNPECYEAVDFHPEDSIEELTEKLRAAAGRLAECGEILILSDLTGGSPFNVSMRMKLEGEWKLEVIGGTNLPAVLDAYMRRGMETDVTALAHASCGTGKEQLIVYVPAEADGEDEFEE